MKSAGRSASLSTLRPIQYLLDGTLFALGILLLVRFGLEVYHSAAMDALAWVVLFKRLIDPPLLAVQPLLRRAFPIPAFRYVPLILSIAVFGVRYVVVNYIKRMRLRLEEPKAAAVVSRKKKDGSARDASLAGTKTSGGSVVNTSTPAADRSQSTSSGVTSSGGVTSSSGGASSSSISGAVPSDPGATWVTPGTAAPSRFGRYQVLEELGRGAMGAVYKASDPQIDRTVALKVILTRDLSPSEQTLYKERFYREARAAGKMTHPGIITVHDIAEDATGEPFLVMEYVEGKTLDALANPNAERMDVVQCVDFAIQIAEALDYAHSRGVVHRDIKPANILITLGGQAKIADFGVAKLLGTTYTQVGAVIGTPAFMAPEQLSGAAVDARSDLFSFGVVLYWMLTGEKPFAGDTVTAITYKVVHTIPLSARQLNPALPPDLDVVLMRCLAKNASDRYQSARELVADLLALKAGRPLPSASSTPK